MPVFRTQPSGNLTGAIRRLMASGGSSLNPLQEMQADSMAADQAHKMGLIEQMRAKLESDRAAEARRADPAARTEYAGHAAGIDLPDATRLYKAISGARERPSQSGGVDMDDEGNVMPDVTFAKPTNLAAGAERIFRSSLAALQANQLATGKTNAEQLAQAGGHLQKQDLIGQAANAPDVETGNRLMSAVSGHLRAPFRTNERGITTNVETGARDESGALAQGNVSLAEARAVSERAQAGERGAHSGLYRAQTDKLTREASGADDGLPAQAFRSLTGAKLSDLAPEVRLAWLKNHAQGMDPVQNLVSLTSGGGKRDALMQEARQVYETQYPKTLMGQRDPRAPNFLDFADQYVQLKEGGQRTPRPDAPGRNAQGKIRGPGEAPAQQVARPKSQADFDALPRGAVYIDPDDGKSYRKR